MAKFGFVSKNKESDEPEAWMKKIMNAAGHCWESVGSMSVDFSQCTGHWHMSVTPSLRELAGGGVRDGERVFAQFTFNLPKFVKAFDKIPSVRFQSGAFGETPPGMDIRGRVMGVKVFVAVFGMPLPNQPVTEVAYISGPKEGTVEARMPQDEEPSEE